MPESYVCPHCQDTGHVSMPYRYHRRERRLGHSWCDCCDCRYLGAHRQYVTPVLEDETAQWLQAVMTYACRFCSLGPKFSAWKEAVLHNEPNTPSAFVARRDGPASVDEMMRIQDGLRWDLSHPLAASPRFASEPSARVMPPDGEIGDAEWERKREEIRRQATELVSA